MSSESRATVNLAACATFQEGYVNPSQRDPAHFGTDYKWLRATDLNNGFVINTGRGLSKKGFASAGKSALLFEPDTLAISKSGTIGRIGILKDYMCGNRAVINIKVNPDCDTRFIFYTLLLNRQKIETLAEGSVQKNLYVSSLGKLQFQLPPLSEQKRISETVGALDDRIALLRETNATLEAIAQALFKSWFVDFDPVHAKQQGIAPEGMDDATAALFPDSFEGSELGLVPRGWRTCAVYDLATYINGAAYKAFEPNLERRGWPIIKIAELKAGVTSQTAYSDVAMPEKYRIETGDILFSWSGNPDTSIDTFIWHHSYGWLNQHIFRVIPHVAEERSFVLQILRYLRPTFAELARNKQTTGLGHVTVADMKRLYVIQPDKAAMGIFNETVSPVHARIFENEVQAQTLATLRDTLLPRLISGQLRLPEVEAQL